MDWPYEVIEKIWARVVYPEDWIKGADNSKICLEWSGPFDNFKRPKFYFDGKYIPAKRVMFESWFGPIDDEKVVSNTCCNKKCVRPDHLRQNYFFMEETFARNGMKDPKDRRRKMRVKIYEEHMLRVFNGIKGGWLKSINEIGVMLNVENSDVIEFLKNDKWDQINKFYSVDQLNEMRKKVGLYNQ
jgi:hypothetical protein